MSMASAPAPEAESRTEYSAKRAADWYELFFDLVFVVVIAIAVGIIEHDQSLWTVFSFALLLFPLWWAWANLMVTNNLFGEKFPAMGPLIIAAMPGPAAMAIAISEGIENFGWLYAIGAAWIRLVLLVMWLLPIRAGYSSASAWRPISYNLATAILWLASVFLFDELRYLLWAAAVVLEIALLAWRSSASHEIYDRASISHALDRIGLFMVIVVGEAVYLSVTGLAARLTAAGAAAALAGFVICALLVRAFFRWGVSTTETGLEIAQRSGAFGALRDVVMYLPFVLILGLTFVAASIGVSVKEASEPLPTGVLILLALGLAMFYITNALIGVRLGRPLSRILMLLIPALLLPAIAVFGGSGLPAWVTVALAAFALVLIEALSLFMSKGAKSRALEPELRSGENSRSAPDAVA